MNDSLVLLRNNSSIRKSVLTHFQKCIYDDLVESIKENRVINRDSIVKLYLDSKYPGCNRFRIKFNIYYPTEISRDDHYTRE